MPKKARIWMSCTASTHFGPRINSTMKGAVTANPATAGTAISATMDMTERYSRRRAGLSCASFT